MYHEAQGTGPGPPDKTADWDEIISWYFKWWMTKTKKIVIAHHHVRVSVG
jgi:hypothetical protein